MPRTSHLAPRTSHLAPRTSHGITKRDSKVSLFARNLLLMFSLALAPFVLRSQCESTDLIDLRYPAAFGNPVEFSLCDLVFDVTLEFTHDYLESHDYTVSITFRHDLFNLLSTTPAWANTPTMDIDANGNLSITGTFRAPVPEPPTNMVQLVMRFERLRRWDNVNPLSHSIRYVLSDPSCSPSLIADFQPPLFCRAYQDLRNLPSRRASDLLNFGFLNPCPPGADNILLDGELIVDVNHCFTLFGAGASPDTRLLFRLLPGSKITIESGVTLFMDRVDLQTCGSELAEGIVVKAGATLMASNSRFSDCRFAINAYPAATLALIGNSFSDNYIGLNLDMSEAPAGGRRVGILAMRDNSFTTTRPLKAPYVGMPEAVETLGYCGILLRNYEDFNVFGPGINTFSRLANGIVGYNSTGNIGNMAFTDITGTEPPSGSIYPQRGFGIFLSSMRDRWSWFNINLPFTTMDFTRCLTGIRAINYAGKVEGTVMSDVTTGIEWSGSHLRDVRFLRNTITARSFGIRSYRNEPLHPISMIDDNTITITGALAPGNTPTRGIELNELGFKFTSPGVSVPGINGWRVQDNRVNLTAGGIGISYRNGVDGNLVENTITNTNQPAIYTGILVEGLMNSSIIANTITQASTASLGISSAIQSSAGIANTYQCNCLDQTTVGMRFFDMADYVNAVRGNRFHHHCSGLQIENNAFIGKQVHTGNRWDLNAIMGSCLGGRNLSDPTYSIFEVNGDFNSALKPPVWPEEGWFVNKLGSTFTGCGSCEFPLLPPWAPECAIPTEIDRAIADGSLGFDGFEAEMQWKAAYRLCRKLLRHPSLMSTELVFADFKAYHEGRTTGLLAAIAEARNQIFTLSAEEDLVLEQRRALWYDVMTQLLTLDSLRYASDSSVTSAQYDSVLLQTHAARQQYVNYAHNLMTTWRERTQTLLTTNAAISADLTPAQNHKAVNDIVFRLLLNDSLSTGDMATLADIAGQCPLEGGDAVYEARAIVAALTAAHYEDIDLCNATVPRERQQPWEASTNAEASVVLYPNPTTGQVFWTTPLGEPLHLRVFNALGQPIADLVSTEGMTDLSHLPKGFLIVQVWSVDSRILKTLKLHLTRD